MTQPPDAPEIGIVRRVLATGAMPGVVAGWVYGSAARGRLHQESDIDVALLLDRTFHPTAAARFEVRIAMTTEILTAITDRRLVDVIVLNDVSPLFARRILREGIQVFSTDPGMERAFYRDVQLQAADLAPFAERNRRRAVLALAR